MDSSKIWKADRKKNAPCSTFKYRPFGVSKSNLEKLGSIGYEEVIDIILRQVCELQPITRVHLLVSESQFENVLSKDGSSRNSVLDL